MNLYILRHGAAMSAEDDSTRALSVAGRKEVEVMAGFLLNCQDGGNIKEILHSTKLRAQQTAEIIHNLACPQAVIQEHIGLLPEDYPADIQDFLTDKVDDLMIVSHLPFVGLLSSLLSTNDAYTLDVQFTTASMLCLHRRVNRWGIKWLVYPKLLGA